MPVILVQPKCPKGATSAHKVRRITWIPGGPSWMPALLLVTSASAGCAAETPDPTVETRVSASTSAPSIFGGNKDDDGAQGSAPGVVALRVGDGSTFELCSGTLIAPNVVLTARHCVTK